MNTLGHFTFFGWDRGWAFWQRPNTNLSTQLWS